MGDVVVVLRFLPRGLSRLTHSPPVTSQLTLQGDELTAGSPDASTYLGLLEIGHNVGESLGSRRW